MARPSYSNTKSISLRIPMSDHFKICEIAKKLKMSVSEYLTLKIFASTDEIALEALRLENNQLKQQLEDDNAESLSDGKVQEDRINELMEEIDNLKNEAKVQEARIKALMQEIDRLKNEAKVQDEKLKEQ